MEMMVGIAIRTMSPLMGAWVIVVNLLSDVLLFLMLNQISILPFLSAGLPTVPKYRRNAHYSQPGLCHCMAISKMARRLRPVPAEAKARKAKGFSNHQKKTQKFLTYDINVVRCA
jgi:hypothetical protein